MEPVDAEVDQCLPFQRRIKPLRRRPVPPTAKQLSAVPQATPARPAEWMVAEIDQCLPFQRRTSRPPTAKHSLTVAHATPSSVLWAGLGVTDSDHFLPFQRKITLWRPVMPTAKHSRADPQATPLSCAYEALRFGVLERDHVVPFQRRIWPLALAEAPKPFP